jgi:hypothetical protein
VPGPFTGNPFAGRFGTFQRAVNDPAIRAVAGGVQMYVWQDLRNEYLSRGESLPAGAFQAVNQLLSLAGQQRRASAALSEAFLRKEQTGLEAALLSNHTAPAIDSRALNDMVSGPQHRVIYRSLLLVEGEPILQEFTHDFGFDLPQSLSGLQDQVDAAAQIVAADYEYEWGGAAVPLSIQSY